MTPRLHPCVFVGTLPGKLGPEIFKQLMATKAMQDYRKDMDFTMMSAGKIKGTDGQTREVNRVGVSFADPEPKDQAPP